MSGAAGGRAPMSEFQLGLVCSISAYGMWGFMPAYYKLTSSIPSDYVICHRILWSVVLLFAFMALTGRLPEIVETLKKPRIVAALTCSACLIALNWLVFVWAIAEDHVLQISFGYFINPLLNVVLGLVIFRETLRRLQVGALLLATVGVAIQAWATGGLPWVSLVLAGCFAGYAVVRKITPVKAIAGLFVETLVLVPVSALYLAYGWSIGEDALPFDRPWLFLALIGTGGITAVPLILFSASARRLPMILTGLLQYIAPSIHFLMAVYVWGEPLDQGKLLSFAITWLALAVFSYDSLRQWQQRRAVVAPA